MTSFVLKIYNYLHHHRRVGITSFLVLTLLLIGLASKLNYKEDIMAFLPMDSSYQDELHVFRNISNADKIFVLFQSKNGNTPDADEVVSAIDNFTSTLKKLDNEHIAAKVTAHIDLEKIYSISSYIYKNIPYFLAEEDYLRMDSLLAQPGFIRRRLEQDKQLLMFPTTGVLTTNLQFDPLGLFTPVVSKLQSGSISTKGELYDGYMFTSDMKHAVVIIESPFGSSETKQNVKLINLLKKAADASVKTTPNLTAHITGGPAIAVGNAHQIKSDSILSVSISVVLIILLLFITLKSGKSLLLILFSVAWGGLFALGGIAVFHTEVSVIVIGISSVIIGIAVNYPLHFIAHLEHTPSVPTALKEIVMPLLIGNITTVGAFLVLVPLQSQALRDLGLFSSFLLIGTILFVIICLPHIIKAQKGKESASFLNRICAISLHNKACFVWIVVLLTFVFGYYSLRVSFDSNMAHINYMTPEQTQDMRYFSKIMAEDTATTTIYAISSASSYDRALDENEKGQSVLCQLMEDGKAVNITSPYQFITSKAEQLRRLKRWNDFKIRYKTRLTKELMLEGNAAGFNAEAFIDFFKLLDVRFTPQPLSFFSPLKESVFATSFAGDKSLGRYYVVNQVQVKKTDADKVIARINALQKHLHAFSVQSMNSTMVNHLSSDFNYVGWACGLIVFFFLWLSFGSIELAALSFLPMAISWLWILGIMSLLGVQFNIVNVILATFIFGQGDDYTIFITEGLSYEYAYRKKVLISYKNSIIISALIMFIGIGTLILAKHPALHSLAEVTIIGMLSVVLMAYIFPPLIFNWITRRKGEMRLRPITIKNIFIPSLRTIDFPTDGATTAYYHSFVIDRYRYKGVENISAVKVALRKYNDYSAWIDNKEMPKEVFVMNAGCGEFSLLLSLVHPQSKVYSFDDEEDKRLLVRYSAEGVMGAKRLTIVEDDTVFLQKLGESTDYRLFLLHPTDEQITAMKQYNPIVIG